MRWKKTSIETKAKIIEEKINNPSLSTRDIEAKTWADHSTVSRVLENDLQQIATASEKTAELIDRNNRLQSLADSMIEAKILAWEDTIKISELVTLRQSTFTQNQLIQGKATERVDFTWLDDSQAQLIASRYASK